MPSTNYEYDPFDGEALSVGASAVGVTSATAFPSGNGAQGAVGDVQGSGIRFRIDGTAPTATVGYTADPGDTIYLESPNEVINFSAIRKDGVDATVHFTFYR